MITFPDNSPACTCGYCVRQGGGVRARDKLGVEICSGCVNRYVALYGEDPTHLLPLRHFDEVPHV